MPKTDNSSRTIARNRRARFNYSLEKSFKAGIVLEGWELKSIRAGKVQLVDTYVIVREREVYLVGARINPVANRVYPFGG